MVVTPPSRASRSTARTCTSRCSKPIGGITLRTRSAAAPFRTPVSRPPASFAISPPGGAGVDSVMPASFRARLLARNIERSKRFTKTGWSGLTASIIRRSGVKGPAGAPAPGVARAEPAPHCS